jgi:hypothetical protein
MLKCGKTAVPACTNTCLNKNTETTWHQKFPSILRVSWPSDLGVKVYHLANLEAPPKRRAMLPSNMLSLTAQFPVSSNPMHLTHSRSPSPFHHMLVALFLHSHPASRKIPGELLGCIFALAPCSPLQIRLHTSQAYLCSKVVETVA